MLDRTAQRAMLDFLAASYPNDPGDLAGLPGTDAQHLATAHYLAEHGLVAIDTTQVMGEGLILTGIRITAAGLDFLADDGGLSAVLGVVTIRFEAETLRALIEARLDAAAPPEQVSALKRHLRTMTDAALKRAVDELVRLGLSHLPDPMSWLHRLLGPAS